MESAEVLLVSARNATSTAVLYDYRTCNPLHTYKNGGTAAPNTLNLLGQDYLMCCEDTKPLVHVYPVNSQEPVKKLGTVLGEKAQVLSVCPHAYYLAGGIGPKLHLWHLSTGKLLTVQKRHFQPVSKIRFSADGAYVVVGGQDGQVVVYNFLSLVSFHQNYMVQNELGQVEPHFTKHDHNMPITDLHVGIFAGNKARLATVSSDNSCKLYQLSNGDLILSLVFEQALNSCVFDATCWHLYTGGATGKIHKFLLKNPPRTLTHHVTDSDSAMTFQGHTKRVTCLALNGANDSLVSGSDDGFVFVWEILSRQIVRRIDLKGAVTNLTFVPRLANFFVHTLKPKLSIQSLQRELIQDELFTDCKMQETDLVLSSDEEETNVGDCSNGREKELERENEKLRVVNKQLYDTAMLISRKYNGF